VHVLLQADRRQKANAEQNVQPARQKMLDHEKQSYDRPKSASITWAQL
jgi:hypothetical protein